MQRNEITLAVWINEAEAVKGDWSTTHMVFRNMNGANFAEGHASIVRNYTHSHEQYLAQVSAMLDLPVDTGAVVSLRSGDGDRVFLEHRIGLDAKGETRPGDHYHDYAGQQYQEGA